MAEPHQLALAERVGHFPEAQVERGVAGAAAQVERVGDQVVAEHHRHLVAAQVVHAVALATHLGLVEHVVVHERGHVDHLAGGGHDHVPLAHRAERLAAEEHHRGPQHLAAVTLHVAAQRVDRRQVARELALEGLAHFRQERRELGQSQAFGAGRDHRGFSADR